MKRVLLYLDRNQFEPYDYRLDYKTAMNRLGGNSGNAVFQFALQTMLTNKDIELTVNTDLFKNVAHDRRYFEQINANYDCVVYSPANILAQYAKDTNFVIAKSVYESIDIPIYAIGLGAQSDYDYSFAFLDGIKKDAYEAFRILLDKGGRLGLRGHFTAECLKKVGFSERDFTVTGCPSLFMRGGVSIKKSELSAEEFRPLINGFRAWNDGIFHQYFDKYPKSIFVCQEEFYRLLYLPDELTWKEHQYLTDNRFFNMYKRDRIKLYGDFPTWFCSIKNLGINFSLGCRIHGNIVPLLAGIPAYIDMFDSRVRELAEYFEIPGERFSDYRTDPFEYYQKADYTKFNANFDSKYQKFKSFMAELGLPCNALDEKTLSSKIFAIPQESKIILASAKNKPNDFLILNEKIAKLEKLIALQDERIANVERHGVNVASRFLGNEKRIFCVEKHGVDVDARFLELEKIISNLENRLLRIENWFIFRLWQKIRRRTI